MTSQATLRVCALYPTLMNVYADRGNLMVLRDRCRWRGIGFELCAADLGEEVDGTASHLYYLGGGQDSDQRLCADDLVTIKRPALEAAVDRGAIVLGVCGGYQLLGHSYHLGADRLPGLGLVDLETVREPGERLVGNAAVGADDLDGLAAPRLLAGFENHGGRTYLGDVRPLGTVLQGHGNNGRDGAEGAMGGPCGNVIGTYLHGPVLPKNAWFADWLIATSLGMEPASLEALDDAFEEAGHAAACRAAGIT